MKLLKARRERASAIAMAVVFLAVVGILAFITSGQASFVRRASLRSHYGFEAVEVCESAINEAHTKVVFKDVFPDVPFQNFQSFCTRVAVNEDVQLDANYPGYKMFYRKVTDGATNQPIEGAMVPVLDASGNVSLTALGIPAIEPRNRALKLFVSMSWPEDKRPHLSNNYAGFLKSYDATASLVNAQTLTGFKSLSTVKMSVLQWRRDYAGIFWQDWGVLHYEVTCKFDDGQTALTRTMHVDRMFTLYAHTPSVDSHQPPDPPGADPGPAGPFDVFVHFIKSRSNLRTVIIRG